MWNNWTVELSLERIANLSSKASPIDRRTSRRREEDDPLGDESPPLESAVDTTRRSSRTLRILVHRQHIAAATRNSIFLLST
ncbi:unnamed protein product [Spirodela intermedia]|uniref:Uncharacterized protein n=1 Tax=Spirodela intermedia TaxID=51605 RepID=A0A7I8ITH6_SPIIN|nr:unnamed protein product [Spirodela intermedia]CAA6661174.1 unnamed protein product [Spirodela intermedia]